MGWYSGATKRPVAYSGLHARAPHKAAILHTNGGGPQLYSWFSSYADGSQGSGNLHVGAHFQVFADGHVEQYVDDSLVIYHAYSASEFALGIETEDDGNPSTPWTDAQLNAIVALLHHYGVPATLLPDGPADGLGYHQEYADWNQSGHECPGPVRVNQLKTVVLPRLAASYNPQPAGDDMSVLVKSSSSATIYATDGLRKRKHTSPQVVNELAATGVYGPESSGKPNIHTVSDTTINWLENE